MTRLTTSKSNYTDFNKQTSKKFGEYKTTHLLPAIKAQQSDGKLSFHP